jgi:integrase
VTGVNKERGITPYVKKGREYWRIDLWLDMHDGTRRRKQMSNIPTLTLARKIRDKFLADAFEGRNFDKPRENTSTVEMLWAVYEPISQRDNDSWQTEISRVRPILRILGKKRALKLTKKDIENYRNQRFTETTRTGGPPTSTTVDLEVELLKRVLNYCVGVEDIPRNPIAHVPLLRKDNVREVMIEESTFLNLVAKADEELKSILLLAYDTGMRKGEVLGLMWPQVDMDRHCIRLAAKDTKTDKPRTVYLTGRVLASLSSLPKPRSGFVFRNPKSKMGWNDIRTLFNRACEKAGIKTGRIEGVIFHDLRRSFVTNARRRGIPESVVMRMSGHRTRNVFDRYNIVNDDDVLAAVGVLENGQRKELAEAAAKESAEAAAKESAA